MKEFELEERCYSCGRILKEKELNYGQCDTCFDRDEETYGE